MAQPIPDVLKHVVALNVEFQVLICVPCKLAVRPATISQHMARTHATAISIRKTLDEYVQGFPFNYDYTDIPLPDDQSIPQPIIPVSEGFLCRSCSYKTQSRRHMKKHGNKEHNKQRTADEDLFQKVQIQSWFGENRARYWIVDSSRRRQHEEAEQQYQIPSENVATTEKNADNDTTNPVPNADAINKKIKQWKIDAQERRLEMLKTAPVVERDSWLQYTNWNEALSQSKHNLLDTFHYTYKPDADEPQLAQVLVAWQRILERCLDTLEGMDNKDVLKWWASPKNEAASQRPFGLPQNRKTIDKYSDIFQRLICYVMRTAPMEQDGETGMFI